MNFAPEFSPEMALLLHPAEGMKTRELPGAGPARARWRRRSRRSVGASLSPQCTIPYMIKSYRQGQIMKLIGSHRLHTQDELARALGASWAFRPRRSRFRATSASWAW